MVVILKNMVSWIQKRDSTKAITLNLAYLIACLIFFVPQNYVDDTLQWYIINGAFTGKTDYLLNWGNDLLGKLLQLFANINPQVPWYILFQYVLSFSVLCLLTYILIRNRWGTPGWVVINIILLFFSYESYIGIVFTKTAGIVGALSCYGLVSDRIKLRGKALCLVLFFFSVCLRKDYLILNTVLWSVFVVVRFLFDLAQTRDRRKVKLHLYHLSICVAFLITAYAICAIGTDLGNRMIDNERDAAYYANDVARSAVYDRGLIYEDYEENKNIYDSFGITKNEAALWHTNNADPVFLSGDRFSAVINAVNYKNAQDTPAPGLIQRVFDTENIRAFFKLYPINFLKIDVFFCVLIVFLLLFMCTDKNITKFILCAAICFAIQVLINYYLFLGGRYARHRVDVPVALTAFASFLFLIENTWNGTKMTFDKRGILVFTLLALVVPENFQDHVSVTDSYVKLAAENKVLYDETYKDQDHAYLQIISSGAAGKPGFYESFVTTSALQGVPSGYYRNILFTSNVTPTKLDVWHEYGINDVFLDIVDNDTLYLLLQNDNSMLNMARNYINDRYGEDVTVSLVKSYSNKNIFRVNSPDYDIMSRIDYARAGDQGLVDEDLNLAINADNTMTVTGSIGIEGMDSFPQNVYLDIIDSQSGEHQGFYIYQKLYKNEGDEVKSALGSKISLPEFCDRSDRYFIVVENNGVIRSKMLQPVVVR